VLDGLSRRFDYPRRGGVRRTSRSGEVNWTKAGRRSEQGGGLGNGEFFLWDHGRVYPRDGFPRGSGRGTHGSPLGGDRGAPTDGCAKKKRQKKKKTKKKKKKKQPKRKPKSPAGGPVAAAVAGAQYRCEPKSKPAAAPARTDAPVATAIATIGFFRRRPDCSRTAGGGSGFFQNVLNSAFFSFPSFL